MAASTKRAPSSRATTRGRTSSNGSGSNASTSRRGAAADGTRSASKAGRSAAANGSKAREAASKAPTSNGHDVFPREAITHVAIPAVTGALGIAGGVLLGRSALQRRRKVLGIPVGGVKIDLSGLGHEIGAAGRQLGRLASEVQAAREKAERVSRAIS